MSERLDALLSARADGVLGSGEARELEDLLAASEAARARAEAYAGVDARLRTLGDIPLADARLERSLAAIRARTSARTDAARAGGLGRGFGLAAAGAALAAGLVLAFWPTRSNVEDRQAPPAQIADAPPSVDRSEEDVADRVDDEVAAALAGDELAALGLPAPDDLEVIAELELLEFLAARDRRAGEPQG